MLLISKKPIRPDCIRKITGAFSWIDHRILSEGFILSMSQYEILLYFFLVLVGDKNGVSFYSYDKICRFLKISPDDYLRARNRLIERGLVAYEVRTVSGSSGASEKIFFYLFSKRRSTCLSWTDFSKQYERERLIVCGTL